MVAFAVACTIFRTLADLLLSNLVHNARTETWLFMIFLLVVCILVDVESITLALWTCVIKCKCAYNVFMKAYHWYTLSFWIDLWHNNAHELQLVNEELDLMHYLHIVTGLAI